MWERLEEGKRVNDDVIIIPKNKNILKKEIEMLDSCTLVTSLFPMTIEISFLHPSFYHQPTEIP